METIKFLIDESLWQQHLLLWTFWYSEKDFLCKFDPVYIKYCVNKKGSRFFVCEKAVKLIFFDFFLLSFLSLSYLLPEVNFEEIMYYKVRKVNETAHWM